MHKRVDSKAWSVLRSLVVLAQLACATFLVACSDDDDADGPQPDSGVTDAGTQNDAGDAATTDAGFGTALEGELCTATDECVSGLRCVIGTVGTQAVGICGRPCATNAECGTEACFTYTGDAADQHCVNFVRAAYAPCGIGETARCGADRTCLYLPQSTIGLCVDLCVVSSEDAGVSDDDAGVPNEPDEASCPDSENSCVTGLLASAETGVCGTYVDRGEPCGLEQGIFCRGENICAPADPEDFNSEFLCRQDCSADGRCDSGSCTDVQGMFAYCL
jgi:hypothetical protein